MKKTAVLLAALLAVMLCVTSVCAGEAGGAAIPEELVGTWHGAGTPEKGSPIDLTVMIQEDGTGEYIFDQAGYVENNPITISYEGNSFSVNTDESVLGGCEGTWELKDGVLTLDITSTLPSGATYSYIAELTKAEEEGSRFVTIREWLDARGECGDCMLVLQVRQILNPVLAVGADETGEINLFSGNGEDSMIINFMSDECPQDGAVLVIANPRYNEFEGSIEMADWTLLRVLPLIG